MSEGMERDDGRDRAALERQRDEARYERPQRDIRPQSGGGNGTRLVSSTKVQVEGNPLIARDVLPQFAVYFRRTASIFGLINSFGSTMWTAVLAEAALRGYFFDDPQKTFVGAGIGFLAALAFFIGQCVHSNWSTHKEVGIYTLALAPDFLTTYMTWKPFWYGVYMVLFTALPSWRINVLFAFLSSVIYFLAYKAVEMKKGSVSNMWAICLIPAATSVGVLITVGYGYVSTAPDAFVLACAFVSNVVLSLFSSMAPERSVFGKRVRAALATSGAKGNVAQRTA